MRVIAGVSRQFIYSLSAVVSAALLEDEETQIGGTVTIIDHADVTMKQTGLFSVSDIVDFSDCAKKAVGRHKQLFLVNMPHFVAFLLDIARSTLSEKLRERIILPKDMNDLKNYINVDLLPKEHGGKYTEQEHKDDFTQYFQSVRPRLDEIHSKVVDWNKIPECKVKLEDTVGSFRKLEID